MIEQALLELVPNAKFLIKYTSNGYQLLWQDPRPQPALEVIAEKVKELEEKKKIEEKIKQCETYIYTYYPQSKQNSDIADKLYYENLLKAKGIENLEVDIVSKTKRYFEGESLDSLISNIQEEDKEAYLQLLKVAIRVAWVQECKRELKKSIEDNTDPIFPRYPL